MYASVPYLSHHFGIFWVILSLRQHRCHTHIPLLRFARPAGTRPPVESPDAVPSSLQAAGLSGKNHRKLMEKLMGKNKGKTWGNHGKSLFWMGKNKGKASIPSGKHTKKLWKITMFNGTTHYFNPCSIAILTSPEAKIVPLKSLMSDSKSDGDLGNYLLSGMIWCAYEKTCIWICIYIYFVNK